MQGVIGAVFTGPTGASTIGSDGGSITTELLEDEEDRIPERMERLSAEDFLLA
jgi:hypothetical protein